MMPNMPHVDVDRPSHMPPLENGSVAFDLPAEIDRLRDETVWSGHNARTLVDDDELRVVLIALHANARMGQHRHGGRVSIHALTGHIQVTAAEWTFDLRAGGLLTLGRGVPHDVEALKESAFLLTMA
jgi:quercetin dioxygenase-like cupin family protein